MACWLKRAVCDTCKKTEPATAEEDLNTTQESIHSSSLSINSDATAAVPLCIIASTNNTLYCY